MHFYFDLVFFFLKKKKICAFIVCLCVFPWELRISLHSTTCSKKARMSALVSKINVNVDYKKERGSLKGGFFFKFFFLKKKKKSIESSG